jgi:hypothetical protein
MATFTSCRADVGAHASNSKGLLACGLLSLLLVACGGHGIVRDDTVAVPAASMVRAGKDHEEMRRFVDITRKVSIQAADLCAHKMPLLDIDVHAMPGKGMNEVDSQAMIRIAGLDGEARVLVSTNPAIKPRALIEKVGDRTIKPSIPGWEFQRAIAYEAVGKDSIDLQIGGKTFTYRSQLVCAAIPLYRLEAEPKTFNMGYASDRFIVNLARNPKPELGLRSDDEIAFLVAMQVAAAAGGKLDDAMSARNVLLIASGLIPVMQLLNPVIGRPLMNSLINQDEIDALAIRMLDKSGFDVEKGISGYLARCGDLCGKSWPAERKERWLSKTKPANQHATEGGRPGGA